MTLRSASEGVPTHQAVRGRSWAYRHSGIVRITHWINVICIAVLLMSGLQIFNAHPALYWGDDSDFAHPAFAITAERTAGGGQRGVTTLFGRSIETTGVLGLSRRGRGLAGTARLGHTSILAFAGGWAAVAFLLCVGVRL